MKGEYVEQAQAAKSSDPPNMFSKLHQHQQHNNPFSHHPFHLSRDSQTSEEDDVTTANHPTKPSADGSSIEVVRRPRGRPPGSKNKPKPPVIITRDPSEPTMSSFILEVPGGTDVVDAITRFCRRKNTALCVLTASGTVANVTLRQPSTTPGATVTFHGRFDILSVSATFLLNHHNSLPALPNSFTISLAGPQGQIVGGLVAGSLLAAGAVFVVAASFNNPSYHRLPPAEEEEVRNSVSGGGEGQSPAVSGGEGGHVAAGDSCGMSSMYSCQLPSDVIWAPTARPPPPPY